MPDVARPEIISKHPEIISERPEIVSERHETISRRPEITGGVMSAVSAEDGQRVVPY